MDSVNLFLAHSLLEDGHLEEAIVYIGKADPRGEKIAAPLYAKLRAGDMKEEQLFELVETSKKYIWKIIINKYYDEKLKEIKSKEEIKVFIQKFSQFKSLNFKLQTRNFLEELAKIPGDFIPEYFEEYFDSLEETRLLTNDFVLPFIYLAQKHPKKAHKLYLKYDKRLGDDSGPRSALPWESVFAKARCWRALFENLPEGKLKVKAKKKREHYKEWGESSPFYHYYRDFEHL